MDLIRYPRVISRKAERQRTAADLGAGLYPSQFYPAAPRGTNVTGFRNENLERLTFLDSSIDLHVTQDVFEQILDPAAHFEKSPAHCTMSCFAS